MRAAFGVGSRVKDRDSDSHRNDTPEHKANCRRSEREERPEEDAGKSRSHIDAVLLHGNER